MTRKELGVIVRIISLRSGVDEDRIMNTEIRVPAVVSARWEVWETMFSQSTLGYAGIARMFGCNHTSVMNALGTLPEKKARTLAQRQNAQLRRREAEMCRAKRHLVWRASGLVDCGAGL